ncbi:MAG: hypothetical protein ACLFSZ_06835 [Puniceicoccaceae bacterium]
MSDPHYELRKSFSALDGRQVSDVPGEPDVYVPGHFWVKLGYVIFSLLILAFGIWLLWEPAARLLFGETSEARIAYIVRTEPGEPDRTIRYAKDIPEGHHTVVYQHYVAVEDEDGEQAVMRLAVDSARKPYAKVNDIVRVVHFAEDHAAFGLFHHRTWAFGLGFLFVGIILSMLSINTLWAVGKPIAIDDESEESLAEEAEKLRLDALNLKHDTELEK